MINLASGNLEFRNSLPERSRRRDFASLSFRPLDDRRVDDRHFLRMQVAFASSGGLVTGDQLADLLRRCASQPISVLARWIVARQVVHFEWHGQTLVPLFQFDLQRIAVRASVARIAAELISVYDNWDLALWFASPNSWLGGASPAIQLAKDAGAVLEAARADRFIAHA